MGVTRLERYIEQLTDMPRCQTTSKSRSFSISDRSNRPKKSAPPPRTARHRGGDATNSDSACWNARSDKVRLTVRGKDTSRARQLLTNSLYPKKRIVRVVKLEGYRTQVRSFGNNVFE